MYKYEAEHTTLLLSMLRSDPYMQRLMSHRSEDEWTTKMQTPQSIMQPAYSFGIFSANRFELGHFSYSNLCCSAPCPPHRQSTSQLSSTRNPPPTITGTTTLPHASIAMLQAWQATRRHGIDLHKICTDSWQVEQWLQGAASDSQTR